MNLNFKHKQSGFSLVEIIVSMAVGSVLVAGVTTVYVDAIKNSADNVASIRLEQDLQAIVQLISQEMRRAGYDGDSVNGGDTDFGITENTATCIRYNYDMGNPPNGTLSPSENFAFRLVDNAVQFGTNVTSCDDNEASWTNVNKTDNVIITAFALNLTELCVNLKNNSNCNPSNPPDDNPYVAPVAGDKMIKKYKLELNITGRSANNSSYTKSIETKIRLLNDIKTTQS